MSRDKGFTLIELIIAIGIGIIVLALAYNILFAGIKGYSSTLKSFENQVDIRYAIETTNNAIRYAFAGFAVTEDDFKPIEKNGDVIGLVKPWNYIGLGPDKKSIVHYRYISTNNNQGYYEMDILAKGFGNLTYGLKFTKPNNISESKIIRYIIEINKNGKKEIITTEIEAINSLHVVDWGDANKPAIALAYRTEKTPEIHKKTVAAVSMVLDVSGSMNWGMDGEGTSTTGINGDNPVRLSLLKNTLNDSNYGLFSIFKDSDVYISLVPFSTNANIPHNNYKTQSIRNGAWKFYNVKEIGERNKLIDMVNDLIADGGTNTGDGLRRAYHQLEDFNSKKSRVYNLDVNQKVKNYMIVLVDGVTTAGSANIVTRQRSSWLSTWWEGRLISFIDDSKDVNDEFYRTINSGSYRLVNGNFSGINSRNPVGHGAELDSIYGESYVQRIGNLIQNSKIVDQAFVIGYSNATKRDNRGNDIYYELESLSNIARSLGIAVDDHEASEKFKNNDFVFIATDRESLKKAFEDIGGYISEELWQVEGPRLNP